jgi:HAD superfamily hydrolase (TIGR01549 family)
LVELTRENLATRGLVGKKRLGKLERQPEILIFDVDGVLVDVRGTYWRSALETVRYLTGKRVTFAELHRWKSKPGYNDDWRMTADWASRYELNLFTGRNRKEFTFTFEKWPGTTHFKKIITMEDVARIKPHPEGLHKILGRRDPESALYLGDNIDDALAARDAGMPFMAIIAPGEHGFRERAKRFRELGAVALLARATDLNEWLELCSDEARK